MDAVFILVLVMMMKADPFLAKTCRQKVNGSDEDDEDDDNGDEGSFVIVEAAVHLKFSTLSALLSISRKSPCTPHTDHLPAKL